MSNATHDVKVVEVKLTKHPNADKLSIAQIEGWTCVVRTEDFINQRLGEWVPPDNLVNTSVKGFEFLLSKANQEGYARIKAVRLRGEQSFGLLVPLSSLEGSFHSCKPEDILTEQLKVKHYNPLDNDSVEYLSKKGVFLSSPSIPVPAILDLPKYDLEPYRSYSKHLQEGEPVFIFEKMDGTSARAVVLDGTLYVGSRNRWVKEFDDCPHITREYLQSRGLEEDRIEEILQKIQNQKKTRDVRWAALMNCPELLFYLEAHPNLVVYFEVAGNTNCIKYGFESAPFGPNFPFVFDIYSLDANTWFPPSLLYLSCIEHGLPMAPLVYCGEYSEKKVMEVTDGKTCARRAKEGVIREGIVVWPENERTFCEKPGRPEKRLKLKNVSVDFLEKYR